MSTIATLIDQRQRTWDAAQALNDATIAADTRDVRGFTADEQVTWDRMNGEIDGLDARIKSLTEAEARATAASAALPIPPAVAGSGAPQLADQFRAVANGEQRSTEIPVPPSFRMSEARDLVKGTATAGGNTVPTSFHGTLMAHLIEVSGIMMAGPTVFNTAGGESFEVPVTTGHSTAALTAEAAAIAESDPAFAKRTLSAHRYAVLVQVARELLDDTGVDLLGYIAMQAGRAVGNAFGVDLAVGNGSAKPSGIAQTSTLGVTGAASVVGAFSADNLIDLQYSVIAPYRNSPSCAWLMRDATLANVRKLKDTTNQYLWQPALQVGAPDVLLGKPVYTDPNIAAVALSAKSVLFGDISQYLVRFAGGVRFERSDEFAFNTDLVTFKCVVRGDGIQGDQTGAVKHFAGNAA